MSTARPVLGGVESAALVHPAALLRLGTVKALTGLGTTSIYTKMASGDFPAQIRLSQRCVRWRQSSIMAWLESLEPVK